MEFTALFLHFVIVKVCVKKLALFIEYVFLFI